MDLSITAKVYDYQTREYVQRTYTLPISQETMVYLQHDLQSAFAKGNLKIQGHGTHDSGLPEMELRTPIADEKHFHIDVALKLLDKDEILGGFQNL